MVVVCSAFHHRFPITGCDFSTAMQRWADGDATHDAGARSIAEVVKAARAMTGKPALASDEELVEWLKGQEVFCETDLLNLSDTAWAAVQRAPGATLVLLDALEHLRARPRPGAAFPEAPPIQRQNSGSICGKSAVEMEVHGFIGIITMCNESKRNALSQHVCDELSGLLDRCCSAGVRVVILRSSPGVKVWSSGHDVRDFKRVDGSDARSFGKSKFQDPLSCEDSFVKLLDRIRNLPVPVLGSIEGTVWGGATDICACCDVLIATPQTTFAITPAKIGLPYNHSGMSHFIQVMPLHIVKWMFFSGEPISADQALQIGFLNDVVPVEKLEQRTQEMAHIIASRAPLVVHLLKRQLLCMSPAPSLTPEVFEELHEKRKQTWSSNDMEEGVQAFFAKRPPSFRGN